MLNLHQLWLFKNVADYGGFTAAAEKLHISQPSVSIQVRRLEEDLNLLLYERCGRRLQLTQAGEELYRYANRIFNLTEEAEQSLRSLQNLKGAKIRVGASTTPGMYVIPSVVAEFRRRYPGVEVDIQIAKTRAIEEKLLTNSIDLAVLGEELNYDLSLTIEPLMKDRLVAICGNEHEMAGVESVSLKTLAEQNFVLREKGSSTRDMVDNMLSEKGLTLREIWELPFTESIKQVVMANWGISILSFSSIRSEVSTGSIVVIPIEEKVSLSRSINLARHRLKRFSPATDVFYRFLKNAFERYEKDAAK